MLSPSSDLEPASSTDFNGKCGRLSEPPNGVLAPDREQLARFVKFAYARKVAAGDTGIMSLRCFPNNGNGKSYARLVRDVRIASLDDIEPAIDHAYEVACIAAKEHWTFAVPPLLYGDKPSIDKKTHKPREYVSAGENNIKCADLITADLDGKKGDPREAYKRCVALIGEPCLVVKSGGFWKHPETGELVSKVHLYWRTLPARKRTELLALKELRRLVTEAAGDDATSVNLVQPYRVAGSVHNKDEPRLCSIVKENPGQPELDPAELVKRLAPQAAENANGTPVALAHGPRADIGELGRAIVGGQNWHHNINALALALANARRGFDEICSHIGLLMECVPERLCRPEWQARYDDIPRAVQSALDKVAAEQAGVFENWNVEKETSEPSPTSPVKENARARLRPLDLRSLMSGPDLTREFVVTPILPLRKLAAFFAVGGIGKTWWALQLALAVASGRPFFGLPTKQGKVLALFCEEDALDIYERMKTIMEVLDFPAGCLDSIDILARDGGDNVLFSFDNGKPEVAPLFDDIWKQTQEERYSLVIVDNATIAFTGNENAKREVQIFTAGLKKIAQHGNCAVLLVGHTAKSAESQYGGSVGWDATTRTRMFLKYKTEMVEREGGKREAVQLEDDLIFELPKANYVKGSKQVMELYRHASGALLSANDAPPEQRTFAHEHARRARELFCLALERCRERQVILSDSEHARQFYAPRYIVEMEVLHDQSDISSFALSDYKTAMKQLLNKGEIVVNKPLGFKTKHRKPAVGLAVAGAAFPEDFN